MMTPQDKSAIEKLRQASRQTGISLEKATLRRSSSRFCLGVEHGDYNGTELFGVGTDRFIWLAYKPRPDNKVRLFSQNVPEEGVVEFTLGQVPPPQSTEISHRWARFPLGTDYILRKNGFPLRKGFDAILYGDIPGGGMSRSASLTLNLILTLLEVNGLSAKDSFQIVDLAQAVENEYIGSPCGQLDQIMILFAKEGMGTHYDPKKRTISYVPLGPGGEDLHIVVMDTGTDRPGLDKSTYKIRRDECERFAKILASAGFPVSCLADVRDESLYHNIEQQFATSHPDLFARLRYIYQAQNRFYRMMDAWKSGDIVTVGQMFREDGVGLRDDYRISGPELETMCDLVRTVPGVLGERMLGGGDKGAAGALVKADAVEAVRSAVHTGYPRSRPEYQNKFAVHVCKVVNGITVWKDAF